jgi:CxxC motif-containing protein
MKERNLTCIVCPRGCSLTVKFGENGEIKEILGNACKRGLVYGENECTHPMRTVTSTVRCADGSIISVKTVDTVPKERVFEVMAEINKACPAYKVKIGDIIIENVLSLGVNVVATSNSAK